MAADKGKKIKVVCHGCGARYQVSSDKVVGRRFRATCKRCGGIIVARCTNAFTVQPEDKVRKKKKKKKQAVAAAAKPAGPSWYVVISGKPHGPLTPDDLRQSFDARKISERSYIWKAGDGQWRRLEDVEEFADLLEETTNFYRVNEADLPEDEEETISGGDRGVAPAEERHPAFRKAVTAYPDIEDEIAEEDVTEETTVHFQKQAAEELEQATRHRGFAAEPEEPAHPGGGIFDDGPADDPAFGGDDAPYDEGYDDDQVDAPEHLPEPGWGQPATEWGPADELWPAGPVISARKAFLPMPTGRPRLLKLFIDALKPKREPPPVPAAPLEVDEVSGVEMLDPSSSAVEILPPEPAPAPVPAHDLDPLPVLTAPRPAAPPLVAPGPTPAAVPPAMAPATTMMVSSAFWTKGKIAAAAAICGGLGVAAAVILGVVLARSQPVDPPPNEVAAVSSSESSSDDDDDEAPVKKVSAPVKAPPPAPAKKAPAPAAEPKKEAEAKTEAAAPGDGPKEEVAAAPPVPTPPAPPEPEAKKPAPTPPAARPKPRVARRRVVRRASPRFKRKPRRARSSRRSSADVDALLMGSSSRRKRKKRTSSGGVDGILAAGSRRSSGTLPRKPTKGQIRNTMRNALPRVRKCYDRYRQSGIIKVYVKVSPSGRPAARVVGSFRGSDTAECLLTGVSKLRFPKFSGPAFSFTYPFRLR